MKCQMIMCIAVVLLASVALSDGNPTEEEDNSKTLLKLINEDETTRAERRSTNPRLASLLDLFKRILNKWGFRRDDHVTNDHVSPEHITIRSDEYHKSAGLRSRSSESHWSDIMECQDKLDKIDQNIGKCEHVVEADAYRLVALSHKIQKIQWTINGCERSKTCDFEKMVEIVREAYHDATKCFVRIFGHQTSSSSSHYFGRNY